MRPSDRAPRPVVAHAGMKLNLFLHINGRLPNGYHELQTYFQLVDYGDELQFQPNDDNRVTIEWVAGAENICRRPDRPNDDLIYRAAMLIKQEAAPQFGVDIRLIKNAPVGGGVGGGSATAATTLLVLNHLWNTGMSREKLATLSRTLGADVPIFVHGRSCVADGIGDQFTEAPMPPLWFVVVDPGESIATRALFSDPRLERDTPKASVADLLSNWKENGFNAFEPLVLEQSPRIRRCHEELRSVAGFSRLTGTGGCLFAPAPTESAARAIRAKLTEPKRVMICRGLSELDPLTEN